MTGGLPMRSIHAWACSAQRSPVGSPSWYPSMYIKSISARTTVSSSRATIAASIAERNISMAGSHSRWRFAAWAVARRAAAWSTGSPDASASARADSAVWLAACILPVAICALATLTPCRTERAMSA